MDEPEFCRRQPQEGDTLAAMCLECAHAIGAHVEGGCPLCAIMEQADAMGRLISVHSDAFTEEVAGPFSGVLATWMSQFAALAEALDSALKARAPSLPAG